MTQQKYSISFLAKWIRTRIQDEQKDAYDAIMFIIAGSLMGIGIAFFMTRYIPFLDVVSKAGTLGISLSTIIGVFYYLYKSDEAQDRKVDFLNHIEDKIKDTQLYNEPIQSVLIKDIVVDLLKERINETSDLTILKGDGKKS